jgi:hypothetical protein
LELALRSPSFEDPRNLRVTVTQVCGQMEGSVRGVEQQDVSPLSQIVSTAQGQDQLQGWRMDLSEVG